MPIKIVIDFGGWFCQNQGPKSENQQNQQAHLTGGIREARSRRRCARLPSIAAETGQMLCSRGNLVEPRAEFDARLRTAPLVPLSPINTPFVL